MKLFLISLLLLLASCNPWRQRTFQYTDDSGISRTLTMDVPKGFKKEEKVTDAVGNQEVMYTYSNGAYLYFSYLRDSAFRQFQQFDREMNIPRTTPFGGEVYKGLDPAGLYWSEIRVDSFRFGYNKVPRRREGRFDQSIYGVDLKGVKPLIYPPVTTEKK